MSASPSPGPSSDALTRPSTPLNKHNLTPLEAQRIQLDKLLKDPSKEIHIPKPAREKTLRPPREMMKNVQGSSAGAGSGEFHVYKQNRRREYERLKLMDDHAKKEAEQKSFEERQSAALAESEAKTSKNRLKRQKKKAHRSNAVVSDRPGESNSNSTDHPAEGAAEKKRKLGGGAAAMVFKRPGEESGEESEGEGDIPVKVREEVEEDQEVLTGELGEGGEGVKEVVFEQPTIVIHEDD